MKSLMKIFALVAMMMAPAASFAEINNEIVFDDELKEDIELIANSNGWEFGAGECTYRGYSFSVNLIYNGNGELAVYGALLKNMKNYSVDGYVDINASVDEKTAAITEAVHTALIQSFPGVFNHFSTTELDEE